MGWRNTGDGGGGGGGASEVAIVGGGGGGNSWESVGISSPLFDGSGSGSGGICTGAVGGEMARFEIPNGSGRSP